MLSDEEFKDWLGKLDCEEFRKLCTVIVESMNEEQKKGDENEYTIARVS